MSCEIQEVKPLMCSAWPVLPQIKKGKKEIRIAECPLTPTLSKKEVDKSIEEVEQMNFEVCTGNTQCDDKELDLINERTSKFKIKRLK
jgi:hypothetical protein